MPNGSIALSTGMRNALNSLTDITDSMTATNNRIATGRKVNSAIDNPTNFFTAQALTSKAAAFSQLRDQMGQGLQTIKQGTNAIDQIKTLIESAKGQLSTALSSAGSQAKATSALSFASGSALVAAAVGTATQFDVGDAITISTYNGAGGAGAAGTLTITLSATVTAQYVIDQINGSATLNPAGAPRVRAYLSNGTSGNLVIEQVETNASTTMASGAGNAVGLQIGLTNSGATQDLAQVFNAGGIATGSVDPTSTTASLRTFGTTNASRAAAYSAFATTMNQIFQLVQDAGYNGVNLLKGDGLTTYFNDEGTTSLQTNGSLVNGSYLGLTTDRSKGSVTTGAAFDHTQAAFSSNMQSESEIRSAQAALAIATTNITALSKQLAANATIITTRDTYTKNAAQIMNAGADLLTAADTNEEGANLLALQTRQQLSVTALSLSNQASQAILRLF